LIGGSFFFFFFLFPVFYSKSKFPDTTWKKKTKKQKLNLDVEVPADNGKDSSRKDGLKQLKDDKKDATEKKSKEQRVESISLLSSCWM
jgi:hypothetical protein